MKYVVEFKGNRRGVYNASDNLAVEAGKYVIVQAERGEDMGLVRRTASASEYDPDQPLLNITRLATENDLDRLKFNNQKEIESKEECLKFIQKHQLKMKLVDVEYQIDCNKITFYFTAEKRVDFRELVKDLAATFRTRIELRQIGVRDEAKRIGGFGICGMEQCCSAFLKNFNTISTQMARSQGLALNPQKISGNCGRLLCCLKYEQDFYERILAKFPLEGSQFLFDEAPGTVEKCDIFKEQITVKFEDGEMRTISFGEYSRAMQRGQFKLTGASPITEEISETDNDDLKQIQEP